MDILFSRSDWKDMRAFTLSRLARMLFRVLNVAGSELARCAQELLATGAVYASSDSSRTCMGTSDFVLSILL